MTNTKTKSSARLFLWRNGARGFVVKDGDGFVVASTTTRAEALKIVKRFNSRIKPVQAKHGT